MRKYFLLVALFLPILVFAEASDFVSPEFISSVYDTYTKNYLGADVSSMGNTGGSRLSGLSHSLLNPASLRSKNIEFYCELISKRNKRELDNNRDMRYQSNSPIGLVGISFSPIKNLSTGLSISTPKSILYDDFHWTLPTNQRIIKRPAFKETDFILTNAFQLLNFSLGLNLILTNYLYEDYGEYWSFEYISINKKFIRYQPGIYYSYEDFSFGTSYTFKSKQLFSFGIEKYNTTIPSKFTFETTYNVNKMSISVGLDYEKTSEQSNLYKDRAQYKLGVKIPLNNTNLKFGFFSSPSIFSGDVNYPGLDLMDESQHICNFSQANSFFLTSGFEINLPYTKLMYSVIGDIANNSPVEMFFSVSSNISGLNKKIVSFINE
jgi:hypothetical protein